MRPLSDIPTTKPPYLLRRSAKSRILVLLVLGVALTISGTLLGTYVGSFGWLNPTRTTNQKWLPILSGSMAPALLGPALEAKCGECQFTFFVDGSSLDSESVDPSSDDICCANCGAVGEISLSANPQSHSVRLTQPHESIPRHAIVAIQQTAEFSIKRVAGMPNETIQIRDGDLIVNGDRLRKSELEFEQVAIPVHNDSHRSLSDDENSNKANSRWRPDSQSNWKQTKNGFRFAAEQQGADSEQPAETDWLVYHHSPTLPPPFQRGTPGPIRDEYAYNHRLSRSLNDATDFRLNFDWRSQRDPEWLTVKLSHDSTQFTANINANNALATLLIKSPQGESQFDFPLNDPQMLHTTEPIHVQWGFWDRQIGLSLNHRRVFLHRVDESIGAATMGHERPLAIGITRDGVTTSVSRLTIMRDIHYLPTAPSPTGWGPLQLGVDEYLLLGDNSPISLDGRDPRFGATPRSAIVAVVSESRLGNHHKTGDRE